MFFLEKCRKKIKILQKNVVQYCLVCLFIFLFDHAIENTANQNAGNPL